MVCTFAGVWIIRKDDGIFDITDTIGFWAADYTTRFNFTACTAVVHRAQVMMI